MGDILVDSDFDIVRSLVDTDSTTVPDNVLSSFVYLDAIETAVKEAITDWATIVSGGGNDLIWLKSGTAYMLAARLAARFRATTTAGGGFRIGGYSESGSSVRWDEVARDLMHKAAGELSRISTRTFTRQTLLLADGPTTSGTNVPEYWESWLERVQPRVLDWEEESGSEDDTLIP
jgi:hypothetical protein